MKTLKANPRILFVSYRRDHYETARKLKSLLETKCDRAVMLEPAELALPNEVLTAAGYFELVSRLEPIILGCEAFVALNTPDYSHSWWTRIEVDIWATQYKEIALFDVDADQSITYRKMQTVYSVFFERWFFKYRLGVIRSPDARTRIGRLADACLMVPCLHCNQLLLITKRWAQEYRNSGTSCPTCSTLIVIGNSDGRFTVQSPLGKFQPDYGDTIIALLRGGTAHHVEQLQGREYLVVHYHGKRFPLFRLPDERAG